MSWYTIYNTETGQLIGHTSIEPTNLPTNTTYVADAERQDQTKYWDVVNRLWANRPVNRSISMNVLFNRLTIPEKIKLYSLDPTIPGVIFIDTAITRNLTLSGGILDLDSPVVTSILDMLISLDVIEPTRKQEILQ